MSDAPIGSKVSCSGSKLGIENLTETIDGFPEKNVILSRCGQFYKDTTGYVICEAHREFLGKKFVFNCGGTRCLYVDHDTKVRPRTFKSWYRKQNVSYNLSLEAFRKTNQLIPFGLPVCKFCVASMTTMVQSVVDEPMINDDDFLPDSQQSQHSYVSPTEIDEDE